MPLILLLSSSSISHLYSLLDIGLPYFGLPSFVLGPLKRSYYKGTKKIAQTYANFKYTREIFFNFFRVVAKPILFGLGMNDIVN